MYLPVPDIVEDDLPIFFLISDNDESLDNFLVFIIWQKASCWYC